MKFNFLQKYVVLAALAALFTLQACSDDPEPIRTGEAGFYIVNEGNYGSSNTSISFYDRSTNTVSNDIFMAKNGRPLGDQSQSMTIIDGKGYIVVQGSKKIEVINANDFSSVATITEGLTNPRYLIAISSTKAYVSDWGADGVTGTIKVLDLTTNTVTKTIEAVGSGTNKLLKVSNRVYATNMGGWGFDSQVTIIDTDTDAITGDPLEAGENPNSLQVDKDANLWVATTGDVIYNLPPDYSIDQEASTAASIIKFNTNSKVAPLKMSVDEVTYAGITHLSISTDGTQLYYLYNDAIYSMSTSATALPTTPFKAADHYYGLAVDPFDGSIVACKAPNFSSAGSIEIIDANGTVKGTFTTGIAPNGVAFK